jgi:hypothetical protein
MSVLEIKSEDYVASAIKISAGQAIIPLVSTMSFPDTSDSDGVEKMRACLIGVLNPQIDLVCLASNVWPEDLYFIKRLRTLGYEFSIKFIDEIEPIVRVVDCGFQGNARDIYIDGLLFPYAKRVEMHDISPNSFIECSFEIDMDGIIDYITGETISVENKKLSEINGQLKFVGFEIIKLQEK